MSSPRRGGAASPLATPAYPPIPGEEFDQAEMLAIEKESIGLFISAHPLKEVREALRATVDFPLADLPELSPKSPPEHLRGALAVAADPGRGAALD